MSTVPEDDSRLDPSFSDPSGVYKDSAKETGDSANKIPNHRPYLRKLRDTANPMSETNLSAKSVFAFETSTRKVRRSSSSSSPPTCPNLTPPHPPPP